MALLLFFGKTIKEGFLALKTIYFGIFVGGICKETDSSKTRQSPSSPPQGEVSPEADFACRGLASGEATRCVG
jgi:hypothetical protein